MACKQKGANTKDKNDFIVHCLNVYAGEGYKNEDFLEYFFEDFDSFSVEDFEKEATVPRHQLRYYLRTNGVYVEKKVRGQISDALFKTLKESPPWPSDDTCRPGIGDKTVSCQDEIRDVENGSRNSKTTEKRESCSISFSKKGPIANLFKTYNSDGDRYSGSTNDNFERMFM